MRAFAAVAAVKKSALARRVNGAHWQGPCAIIARDQVKKFKRKDVEFVAEKVGMAARSGVLDVDPVMERMSGSMYAVNRYSAFSYLRVCQIIMCFEMRGETEAAGLSAACRMTKKV